LWSATSVAVVVPKTESTIFFPTESNTSLVTSFSVSFNGSRRQNLLNQCTGTNPILCCGY